MRACIILLGVLALGGCTDAHKARFGALGDPGQITCWSGGRIIYDGISTGKIASEQDSDGWFFKEAGTGDLIRVSGDCIIKN